MRSLYDIYSEYMVWYDWNKSSVRYGDMGTTYSYIDVFTDIFEKIRDNEFNILEIGCHMGYSLMVWKEYFKNSNIVGIDVNKRFIDNTIATDCELYCTDALEFELNKNFDIIFDDSSDTYIQYINKLNYYADYVNENGYYIMMDIHDVDINVKSYQKEFEKNGLSMMIYDNRKIKNRFDDVLIVGIKNVNS